MVSLYRLSQRQIPALMALLAILLLFVAPEVSKALEQRHRYGHDESATADISAGQLPVREGMSDMTQQHSVMPAAHPGCRSDSLHGSHADGTMDYAACGYCQLLVHFPLLLWIFIPFIWLMLVASRTQLPWTLPPLHFTCSPCICQPRAPPLINSLIY